ncbi:hypothetical protein Fmac_015738 [Flemingia macrophylla]|uniref:Gnk2-homologous domain-containing protein n=1 Tax=Flemingia macrophylla TaxID=520843 RepID=A0ABD1MFE1_9FABA
MFATTTQADDIFRYEICSNNKTTGNNFKSNIKRLLSSLASNSLNNTAFYKTTGVTESTSSTLLLGKQGNEIRLSYVVQKEHIHGSGVVPRSCSHECSVRSLNLRANGVMSPVTSVKSVQHATQTLSAECSLSKAAVMWIDECMVRYSNRSFFSIVDTRTILNVYSERNVSDQESFMRLVFDKLNKTADEAAGGNREKMYATSQTDITENRTLYSLAQWTPDLLPNDCRRCLSVTIY